MPVKKPPAAPKLEAIASDDPQVRRVKLRGVTYVIRELSAVDYEKCLRSATEERDGRQVINNQTLFRLMLKEAMVEPDITVEDFMKKPYRVVRYINDIVDDLHYSPEEEEDLDSDDDSEEGEGEAKG